VWGTDTANTSVTVKLGAQQATGTTGSDGNGWSGSRPGRRRSPFHDSDGIVDRTLTDVYVGGSRIGSGRPTWAIRST